MVPLAAKSMSRASTVIPQPPILPKHFVTIPTRVPGQIYNSYTVESTLKAGNKHWFWGRAENTDKDSLLLFEEQPLALLVEERRLARVQAYTVGYAYELPRLAPWLSQSIGSQFMFFTLPAALSPVYGEHPFGMQFFVRFRVSSNR
jgi:hypothetical protein